MIRSAVVVLIAALGGLACGTATQPACSAASGCDGCCLDGVCLRESKRTASACGRAGQACIACEPNLTCNPEGECIPTGPWRLQPVSATIRPLASATWQEPDGGAPDPFVELSCENMKATTPPVLDTFTPTFAATDIPCVVDASSLRYAGVNVIVRDEDGSSSELIASESGIRLATEDFVRGSRVVTTSGSLERLEIRLTPQ